MLSSVVRVVFTVVTVVSTLPVVTAVVMSSRRSSSMTGHLIDI